MKHSLSIVVLMLGTACGEEAPPAGPAVVGSAEAPPPVAVVQTSEELLSWGFEPASADCNGWPVHGADAIRAAPPRSGAYSCKLCANGDAIDLGLARDVGAVRRGKYMLSAWVRRRPQNEAPAEASASIEANSGGVVKRAEAPLVAVREEWDRIETTLDLDDDASSLKINVGSPSADPQRCLFVDDVVLTKL